MGYLWTSHTKVSNFLKSDDIFSVKQSSILSIFHTDIRKSAFLKSHIVTFDKNGNVTRSTPIQKRKILTENIRMNYTYSLFNVANTVFPPVVYEGFGEWLQGLALDHSATGYLKMKVKDKNASYKITFTGDLVEPQSKDDCFKIYTTTGANAIFPVQARLCTITNVKPDSDGIIQLNFKRKTSRGRLFLKSILVSKE